MPALNNLRYGVFVLVAAMIFAFSNVRAEPQALRLAITDLEGLEQLQREFGANISCASLSSPSIMLATL